MLATEQDLERHRLNVPGGECGRGFMVKEMTGQVSFRRTLLQRRRRAHPLQNDAQKDQWPIGCMSKPGRSESLLLNMNEQDTVLTTSKT